MPAGREIEYGDEYAWNKTTPITAAITEAVKPALLQHPHFQAMTERGHFDVFCPECVSILGLDAESIEHLNEWPANLKEESALMAFGALRRGLNLAFRWGTTWEAKESVGYVEDGGALTITFLTPRRKVREALRARRLVTA